MEEPVGKGIPCNEGAFRMPRRGWELVRESGSWRIDSFQLPPEMAASFRPRPDVFPLHLRDGQLFCGIVSVMRARARPEFG